LEEIKYLQGPSLSSLQRAQRLPEVARGFRYFTTRTDVESRSEAYNSLPGVDIRDIDVEEKRMLVRPLRALCGVWWGCELVGSGKVAQVSSRSGATRKLLCICEAWTVFDVV